MRVISKLIKCLQGSKKHKLIEIKNSNDVRKGKIQSGKQNWAKLS